LHYLLQRQAEVLWKDVLMLVAKRCEELQTPSHSPRGMTRAGINEIYK